jgi:hypothetical protein
MPVTSPTRALVAAFLLLDLTISGYCAFRYRDDGVWAADIADRVIRDAKAVSSREKAAALRDFVRSRVKHQGAEHDDRPFLRRTARETIESGKGYCGESTRAMVRLAESVGLRAQRVNLRGPERQHVVAEVEVEPGRFVLYDPQDNADLNSVFDGRDLTADELIVKAGSPFREYSNLNLRRVPVVGRFVQRVKLNQGRISMLMESPWLIDAIVLQLLAIGVAGLYATDRLLVRVYAARTRPALVAQP